jgi:phosphatidylinositol glycan class S
MASTQDADASAVPKGGLVVPTSSSPAVDAPTAQKKPPPETRESLWLRRSVILSFWLVVVFLGLPVWWKTTAIYRAELPLQTMTDWAEGKVGISIRMRGLF